MSEGQSGHSLSNFFRIEGRIMKSRCSEAFKAVDRNRNDAVCLWIRTDAIQIGADDSKAFIERMEKIDAIEPPLSEMLAYGVDSDGKAFSVFPPRYGSNILSDQVDARESERRFMAAVNLIHTLHSQGIFLGDLTDQNFSVDRDGIVRLHGLLGVPKSTNTGLPEAAVLPFFAPETLGNTPNYSCESDVFALGVIGYKLFTGRFPYQAGAQNVLEGSEPQFLPASQVNSSVPPWVDSVLAKCLSIGLEYRLDDATQILKAIADVRREDFSRQNMPAKTTAIKRPDDAGTSASLLTAAQLRNSFVGTATIKPQEASAKRWPLVAGGVALVLGVALLGVAFWPDKKSPLLSNELKDSNDLQQSSQVIVDSDASYSRKLKEIQKLTVSADPVAHHMLVKLAVASDSPELQQAAESGLLERARRGKLKLTALQVEQLLRGAKSSTLRSNYADILNILDPSLPIQDRKTAVLQLVESFPEIALRLSVAQAFDLDQIDEFRSLYQAVLGKLKRLPAGVERMSSLAMIMMSDELSLIFADDILKRRDQLSNTEITYLLQIFAARRDVNTKALANLAMERKSLSPVRLELLKLIRDRDDIPSYIVTIIVRAAAAASNKDDIRQLGQWYDRDVDRVLLGMMTIETDQVRLEELFDTMATKNSENTEISGLVTWIRSNAWEQRSKFALFVGIIAFPEYFTVTDLAKAMQPLEDFVEDEDFTYVVRANDSELLTDTLIQHYPDMLTLQEKMLMLTHEDKNIRIAAVKSITTNDIGGLKLIVDHYEKEKDPDVKAAYKATFWMLKDRK